MALALLASNRSKRRNEILVLAWSPIWMAIIATLMATRRFAAWGNGAHLALGLALALPLWIAPALWSTPDERSRPLGRRHATRFALFIALMTFVQTWFGAPFFFDHLGMEYHFPVTWIVHRTPLFLYFVTIAYFSTYYVAMQIVMRLVRALAPRAPSLATVAARAALAYLVAFAETAFMSSELIHDFFRYRDRSFTLLWGSLCYGTVFFVSLPIVERLDENPGDPPPPLTVLARDVLAVNLIALFLYDLYGILIGQRV